MSWSLDDLFFSLSSCFTELNISPCDLDRGLVVVGMPMTLEDRIFKEFMMGAQLNPSRRRAWKSWQLDDWESRE